MLHMKVVCGDLRKVRPTLEKGELEGPLGMLWKVTK